MHVNNYFKINVEYEVKTKLYMFNKPLFLAQSLSSKLPTVSP